MTYNGTYELDPTHTTIAFVARHAMVTKVRGTFNEWDAQISIDAENPANSELNVTIKTASIDTNNADRDAHVRNEDFFDVENHPEMTFKATNLSFQGENSATLSGELTIKGNTQPVELDVEIFGSEVDPWGNTRVGFEASTQINRKDFGVDWNAPLNSGGMLVSEKIKIEIDGSAVQK